MDDPLLIGGLGVMVLLHLLVYALRVRAKVAPRREIADVPLSWDDRPAILAHVRSHLDPSGVGLTEGGETLPDEARCRGEAGLRWAAGALDGVLGHHAGEGEGVQATATATTRLIEAIKDVTEAPRPFFLKRAYDLLAEGEALARVDALLAAIVRRTDLDVKGLGAFARWVVTRAPDRNAVKMGLALLGVVPGEADRELLLTMGRHEEFTLYASVALQNSLRTPEPALFELARSVTGWGRIHVVERLGATRHPRVKRWLLREGYRNSIMHEYLAHACATAGGLREALEAPAVDGALLDGASDLLRALVEGRGGPAAGMDDYADGAAAATRYLRHVRQHLASARLAHLTTVAALVRFVGEGEADWEARARRGWTPDVRRDVREQGDALVAAPRWRELVAEGLAAGDGRAFHEASAAAKVLGLDTWQRHYERVSERGDAGSWFEISRTDDPGRMARAVALAERLLPLDEIATGPDTELGLGPEWQRHGDLDFVLQGLVRFPGLGWTLVRTGLRSPVTRNRNMALRALSRWGVGRWPAEARALLAEAREREPDEDVRARFDRVLDGEALEG